MHTHPLSQQFQSEAFIQKVCSHAGRNHNMYEEIQSSIIIAKNWVLIQYR